METKEPITPAGSETEVDEWMYRIPSGYDEHSHGIDGQFIDGLPFTY